MTRLQAFATRVTREMLDAEYKHWRDNKANLKDAEAAARAVLERELRAMFVDASVPLSLAAWMATYLDEPAPTPRPLAGHTARRLEDE